LWHPVEMTKEEIVLAFPSVESQSEEVKNDLFLLAGGVPLQVQNYIFGVKNKSSSPAFDRKQYIKETIEDVESHIFYLMEKSSPYSKKQIHQTCMNTFFEYGERTATFFDRKYCIRKDHIVVPLFPLVKYAYQKIFWDDIMNDLRINKQRFLSFCQSSFFTTDQQDRWFYLLTLSQISNRANLQLTNKDILPTFAGLDECNLVEMFYSKILPDAFSSDGLYVPVDPSFPALYFILKIRNQVWFVVIYIAQTVNVFPLLEPAYKESSWKDELNLSILYLSPNEDVSKLISENQTTEP
jgi:hypothetical protein